MTDYIDPELHLLNANNRGNFVQVEHELKNSPLVTHAASVLLPKVFPQRGLLGSVLQVQGNGFPLTPEDKRVYVNTSAPCSAVVCGVQGSGKSHTVSCLLECSLIKDDRIGNLPEPLAGIVFHFDEDNGDRPCEAAYLAIPRVDGGRSCTVPKVTVLVSPSNLRTRTRVYSQLPNVNVQPLYLSEANLNAGRMLSMMGCDDIETMPLYMHTALSILRRMGSDDFDYKTFKEELRQCKLNPLQRSMFKMRTDLLDSYLSDTARNVTSWFGHGELVIVDLSDPFLDGTNAAILFDIILGIFIEWRSTSAPSKKIIVLDEAHKYLGATIGSRLTRTLGSLIRQQRHLGLRIIISTQEPTVIPATILDLSSYIICHRFSAPSWCTHLKQHVTTLNHDEDSSVSWMNEIMRLHAGEALVFSPNSVAVQETPSNGNDAVVARLGAGYLKILTRPRITVDGGFSIMAVHSEAFGPLRAPPVRERPTPSTPVNETHNEPVPHAVPPQRPTGSSSVTEVHRPSVPHVAVHVTGSITPPSSPEPPRSSNALSGRAVQSATPSSSSQATGTRIEPRFCDLIQILEKSKSAGTPAVRSCELAAKLIKARPNIYTKSGLTCWKEYSVVAVLSGVVKVEGKDFLRLASEEEMQSSQIGSRMNNSSTSSSSSNFSDIIAILQASKAMAAHSMKRSKLIKILEIISPTPNARTGHESCNWSAYVDAAVASGCVIVKREKHLSLP